MPTHPSSHPLRLGYATLGGILLSIAGFLPWALAGRPLSRALGEAGMYAVCALAFLALSAPLLHRLLFGPRSLSRFYTLFTAAFIPYSIAWTAGWMALRGHPGSAAGLILGCLAMAAVLCGWFRQWRLIPLITLALLLCQVPGYFLGGWAYDRLVLVNRWINAARGLVGLAPLSFSRAIKLRVKGACTFMADFESLLLADATQRGHDGVICGHIHNAVLRETIRDGRPLLYANCGDWIEKPTALVEHADGRLELLDVEALLREHALEPAGSDLEPIASEVEC